MNLIVEGAIGLDIGLGIEFIRLEGIETFFELRSVLLGTRHCASRPRCLPRRHIHEIQTKITNHKFRVKR